MSLEQVGIDVPLIRLRHIRLFALEEDTLCEQMREVDEALWKALANHQRGPSFPLPKSVPQGPFGQKSITCQTTVRGRGRLTQHPSRPIFLSAYSNLHYLKFGHSREGTPPWDIRYPEEDI